MTDSDKLSLLETCRRLAAQWRTYKSVALTDDHGVEAHILEAFAECASDLDEAVAEAALAASAAAARPARREVVYKAVDDVLDLDDDAVTFAVVDAVLALERSPQPTLSDDEIATEENRRYAEFCRTRNPKIMGFHQGVEWARDVLSGKVKP